MHDIELEKYCAELNAEIMKWYLQRFQKCCKEMKEWSLECQSAMRKFVLSRPRWASSTQSREVLVFCSHYPLNISILQSGSPGMLLVQTAIGIAKAEWMENYILSSIRGMENAIISVVNCVESQDWAIPYIRRKL